MFHRYITRQLFNINKINTINTINTVNYLNKVNTISSFNMFPLKANYCKKTYLETEEWLLETKDNIQIGISQSARDQLGDLVYLDFINSVDDTVEKGEEMIILESVKATETINAPFKCQIVENNTILEDDLSSINDNPEDTWIVKVKKL